MYHKNKYLYNKKDNPGWDGTHNDYLFMDEREFKHNTRRSDKTPYCVINYPDKTPYCVINYPDKILEFYPENIHLKKSPNIKSLLKRNRVIIQYVCTC